VEDEVVIVDRDRRIVDVVPVGPRARFAGASHGGRASSGGSTVAVVDLPPDDIRVIQRVLIERGVLRGEADGIWGPETLEAITVYQRQQGIAVTGSIDMRTVSSLGVSGRLSQQASQSIQSQSSTGAQTSTGTQNSTGTQTSTGQGQTGTAAQGQTGQPSNQQNATGQTPNQNAGQAQNQPSTTTGQGSPSQLNTTGQSPSQSGSSSTASQPSANQSTSPSPSSGSGSSKN